MHVKCPDCEQFVKVPKEGLNESSRCPFCDLLMNAPKKQVDSETPEEEQELGLIDRHESFWTFNSFVTPRWIKVIYPLGAVVWTLYALVSLIIVLNSFSSDAGSLIRAYRYYTAELVWAVCYWLGFAVGVNVSWRILCEGMVLFFKIYERLDNGAIESIDEQSQKESPRIQQAHFWASFFMKNLMGLIAKTIFSVKTPFLSFLSSPYPIYTNNNNNHHQ